MNQRMIEIDWEKCNSCTNKITEHLVVCVCVCACVFGQMVTKVIHNCPKIRKLCGKYRLGLNFLPMNSSLLTYAHAASRVESCTVLHHGRWSRSLEIPDLPRKESSSC